MNNFSESKAGYEKAKSLWEQEVSFSKFCGIDHLESKLIIAKNREELEATKEDKRKAIEDIMNMFDHQFRGAVGTIQYNAEHHNDQRVYIHTSRSMSGLLDIAGVLSTHPETLIETMKHDHTGNGSPQTILLSVFRDLLIDLVSMRNRERMSPHYLAFAQRQGIAPATVKLSEWSEEDSWQQYETMLQTKWDNECGQFITADMATISDWMTTHLLPISIEGFTNSKAKFAEYGTKASVLRVIFTEVLKNAIKHATPVAATPIALQWQENETQATFTCTNPSTKSSRSRQKSRGGRRGHNFIRMIVNNLGGNFEPNVFSDVSSVKIVLPKL